MSETLKKLVCLCKVSGPVVTAQRGSFGKSLNAIRDNNVLCVVIGLSYTLKFLRKELNSFPNFILRFNQISMQKTTLLRPYPTLV